VRGSRELKRNITTIVNSVDASKNPRRVWRF
jgi:hypothetical protein